MLKFFLNKLYLYFDQKLLMLWDFLYWDMYQIHKKIDQIKFMIDVLDIARVEQS